LTFRVFAPEARGLFHRRRFHPRRGVFRGLIQSIVEKQWSLIFAIRGVSISGAVAFTALLFGIIHLDVGAVVAVNAVVLGLVAGELRRGSGSLVPAIIVHACFNCIDAVWR
jgi:membrane protease YdiL (CAAX protease family)